LGKPFDLHSVDALKSPHNLEVTFVIALGILVALTLNFFFRRSRIGQSISGSFERLSPYGPLFVRAAIALAFFYSAMSKSFLGPELPIGAMPYGEILRIALFVISAMIALGFLTEVAALTALAIFTIGFFVFGSYLITYLNYLGEIVVLLLFGTRRWSLDGFIFGPKKFLKRFEKYEPTVLRIFYGVALIYAAITVKLLHPSLTVEVVNHWNLTQFYWLFPSDPLLVTFGAGLAECAIGLFIILGFEMRLTILISLFYITLSLLFFRELVWPHLMLYGISFSLLVRPEIFTLDHLLFTRGIRLWKRPLLPYHVE
jgi:uncharacterized membrane protein YphA (DoxX/SURF4 family)